MLPPTCFLSQVPFILEDVVENLKKKKTKPKTRAIFKGGNRQTLSREAAKNNV